VSHISSDYCNRIAPFAKLSCPLKMYKVHVDIVKNIFLEEYDNSTTARAAARKNAKLLLNGFAY